MTVLAKASGKLLARKIVDFAAGLFFDPDAGGVFLRNVS
jgi:hypothetical protein